MKSLARAARNAAALAGAVLIGSAGTMALADSHEVDGCIATGSRTLRIPKSGESCKANEERWFAKAGPQGVPGEPGPAGPQGIPGPQGPAGSSTSLAEGFLYIPNVRAHVPAPCTTASAEDTQTATSPSENAVSLPLGTYLPVFFGDLTVANGDFGTTSVDIRLVTDDGQHGRKVLSFQSPTGFSSSEFGIFRIGPSDALSVKVTAFASCGTASVNNGAIAFIKIAD